MADNKKHTSSKIASLAGRTLGNENSSEIAKKLAASLISQTNSDKQTGKALETVASDVLQSSKYSDSTKKLAASVLSQSNKSR